MGKYEEVIRRLDKEDKEERGYSVKVLGDEKNKERALGILMHTDFTSTGDGEYHCLSKKIVDAMKEAEIKFKILR